MMKHTLFALVASLLFLLLLSCDKENLVEIAEAGFSLSLANPEAHTFPSFPIAEGEKIKLYYGRDPLLPSFQEGLLLGDTLLFNYPVVLRADNPGRLILTYVQEPQDPEPGTLMLSDSLYSDSRDSSTLQIAYVDKRYAVKLFFKHSHALADFEVWENEPVDPDKQVKVYAIVDDTAGNRQTYSGKGTQVILPAGSTLKGVLIVANDGQVTPLEFATTLTFESDKRYPIHLLPDSAGHYVMDAKDGIAGWGMTGEDPLFGQTEFVE
jgi:hypothetical protein